jgi:hypothetical protein
VRLVTENRVSNDLLPLLFHIPSSRGFLKYYINNKYKQLNIRTMAESFEGKIISNPLANLRPQKMQYGAKVGGFGKVNRQEVFTTTVKAPMLGMYTDTNKNQANDFYPSPAKRTRPMPGLMV